MLLYWVCFLGGLFTAYIAIKVGEMLGSANYPFDYDYSSLSRVIECEYDIKNLLKENRDLKVRVLNLEQKTCKMDEFYMFYLFHPDKFKTESKDDSST